MSPGTYSVANWPLQLKKYWYSVWRHRSFMLPLNPGTGTGLMMRAWEGCGNSLSESLGLSVMTASACGGYALWGARQFSSRTRRLRTSSPMAWMLDIQSRLSLSQALAASLEQNKGFSTRDLV